MNNPYNRATPNRPKPDPNRTQTELASCAQPCGPATAGCKTKCSQLVQICHGRQMPNRAKPDPNRAQTDLIVVARWEIGLHSRGLIILLLIRPGDDTCSLWSGLKSIPFRILGGVGCIYIHSQPCTGLKPHLIMAS